MGSASSTERFERASKTGTLTINDTKARSWRRLVKGLAFVPKLRSMTVSGTHITKPVPPSFLTLSLWSSLAYLDLSHNGITCACALGCDAPLTETHTADLERLIRAPQATPSRVRSAVALPLETLNISGNALHLLPPFLSHRFPRLRRLVCSDNTQPLAIPVSLSSCIGASATLEVIDLCANQLENILLAEESAEESAASPLPALRELLLDRNNLSGTLSLGLCGAKQQSIFPSLKRLSVESQQSKLPLQAVDPALFVHLPELNSLSLKGNANEEKIRSALGKSDVYRRWQEKNAEVINKKIGAGGSAELMR